MMDELVKRCLDAGIKNLRGYYYPTKKNAMVKDFYKEMGFVKVSENESGASVWKLDISTGYQQKNNIIAVTD